MTGQLDCGYGQCIPYSTTVNNMGYSLVVNVETEHISRPLDRAAKHPGFLSRKIYCAALRFRISNYQTLLARYDFNNCVKIAKFLEDLSQGQATALPDPSGGKPPDGQG